MDRPLWAPAEIDLNRPSVARVYDFYPGGSHNFESDRAFAHTVLRAFPDLPAVLRDNRDFLRRVVLHLSARGVGQFLDLGSGIPTVGNVHEVARWADPQARVVYVDHDPVAVAHSRRLLDGDDRARVVAADLREPDRVLAAAAAAGLDLARPVALLAVAVLHFVDDDERPGELMARYMRALAPGSHLVISHARNDTKEEVRQVQELYNQERSPNPMRMRTRQEIAGLFGGVPLVEPGLVPIPLWHPEPTDEGDPTVTADYPGLGGVARRD